MIHLPAASRSPEVMLVGVATGSPLFGKGADDMVERPYRGMLVCDVKDFFGDGRRLSEVVLARPSPALRWLKPGRTDPAIFAEPGGVDGRIDGDIGHVHTLRPEIACKRLSQDALRGLCRSEQSVV